MTREAQYMANKGLLDDGNFFSDPVDCMDAKEKPCCKQPGNMTLASCRCVLGSFIVKERPIFLKLVKSRCQCLHQIDVGFRVVSTSQFGIFPLDSWPNQIARPKQSKRRASLHNKFILYFSQNATVFTM